MSQGILGNNKQQQLIERTPCPPPTPPPRSLPHAWEAEHSGVEGELTYGSYPPMARLTQVRHKLATGWEERIFKVRTA